jgi:hypothetical protein
VLKASGAERVVVLCFAASAGYRKFDEQEERASSYLNR